LTTGHRGWLSAPAQITTGYNSSAVRAGDTTGLSALSPADGVASWGGDHTDVSGTQDEINAVNIAAPLP
jgi:hypothetical protein